MYGLAASLAPLLVWKIGKDLNRENKINTKGEQEHKKNIINDLQTVRGKQALSDEAGDRKQSAEKNQKGGKLTMNRMDLVNDAQNHQRIYHARYYFAGNFNTGDDWGEEAENEKEFAFVLNKIRNNGTITDFLIFNSVGQVIYDSDTGFVEDMMHPKFMDKYF